ncbi:MAG: hypothetical protein AB8D78_15755 [Akkermansiaceae bacterium]
MKIKMSWARRVAMAASFLVAGDGLASAGDFIRIQETEESSKLQTAVVSYERDGISVDLIGAIHLADREYYETLNDAFKGYEVLLFEMVGGENLGGGKKAPEPEEVPEDEASSLIEEQAVEEVEGEDNLAGLRTIYQTMEKVLGLTGQSGVIDYMADNFVHADLTNEEFEALQKKRGESLLGFMIQAGITAKKPSREPNGFNMLRGMLSGRKNLVKAELMHTMAEGDEQIDSMSGENVIIDDRNAKCIKVLDQQVDLKKKKIGVFYGAAHLPDLERRLIEKGFKRVSENWLTAWDVEKE